MNSRFAGSLAFLIALSGIAAAGDVAKPLRGKDDRVILDTGDTPYTAIGRLNFASGRQFCTGTLVAPDKVLTAAHCLVDNRTGKPYRANEVHFVAGQRRAAYVDHAPAKCLLPRKRDPQTGLPTFNDHYNDVAVVVLRRPLRIQPAAFADREQVNPGTLSHPAYHRKRPYLLSVHNECQLLHRSRQVWLTDCDTSRGSSGGPVFTNGDQGLQVMAVMSGTATTKKEVFSLAVPVSAWHDLVKTAECPRR